MPGLTSPVAPLVVACAVVLCGCAAFDLPPTPPTDTGGGQLEKGTPPPTAEADNLESAGHDPYPDLPTNPPPEAEYPGYPRVADVPRDRPTPKPTAEYKVDGLPVGAVTRLSRISSFIGATMDEGQLQTIPYVVYDDGLVQTHGIALVHLIEGKPAELLWDSSRYGDAPHPLVDVKSLYDRLLLVGEDDVALVELDVSGNDVQVTRDYRLGIAGESADSIGVTVFALDIDADGTDEHLATVHIDGLEPTLAVLYEPDAAPMMREVARLGPHAQIMDLDLDGVAELFEPRGDGGWDLQLYDGSTLVDGDPIAVDPPAPAPSAVDGELPPLPHALYFYRDGGVYRWPTSGGSVEEVWNAPPATETSGASGATDWSVIEPTARDDWHSRKVFDVAPDGSLAVLVERKVDADGAVSHRFRVIEPQAGSSWTAPVRGKLREFGLPMRWDVTSDGRWLVYVGYGADHDSSPESDGSAAAAATSDSLFRDWGARGGAIIAVDLGDSGSPDGRVVAPCSVLDLSDSESRGAYGCSGLSLSADGAQVAYSDGQGLWVADLPDGEPQLILEHHYGEFEPDIRVYNPGRWSPDGSKLMLAVGYYEGGDSAILDLTTGEVQRLAGTIEYAGPRSDLAWLPDGSAVVHARPFKADETELSLSLVDSGDTSRVTNLLPQARFVPDGGYHPVSPFVSDDGTMRYAMRHYRDDLYWASGVFTASLQDSAWSHLAELPLVRPERTYHHDVDAGDVIWSPDGGAFVATESERLWHPVANEAVLGIIDSGGETRTWDVSDVLNGAWALIWTE